MKITYKRVYMIGGESGSVGEWDTVKCYIASTGEKIERVFCFGGKAVNMWQINGVMFDTLKQAKGALQMYHDGEC